MVNTTTKLVPDLTVMNRDIALFLAKPRQIFNACEKTKPPDAWSFENSFFAGYKNDNEAIMYKCFEFDWKSGVFDRILKNQEEKEAIKNYLRPIYKLIREAYKHMSSMSPAGIVPSIGMNSMTELMLKARDFVDYVNIKLSDVDLAFISTNAATARVH